MKAIITNDQGNVGALKLRLQAEGANDRTLMLLLELQYPMIHRTGCSGGGLPDTLEVPVASPGILQLPAGSRLSLCPSPELEIAGSTTVVTRSDPWEHATMPGARLRIQDPGDWDVVHLILNGRSVPPDGAHDVHPGAIAELKVTLLLDARERRPLVSYLESPRRDESPDYTRLRRLRTGIKPIDRVLGGGLVAGGSVMVSGEPKDGMSLLGAQMIGSVRRPDGSFCEVAWMFAEGPQALDVDQIITHARKMGAEVLVVDSIQTIVAGDLTSPAGSPKQCAECARRLVQFGKDTGCSVVIICQTTTTKDGRSGLEALEHLVDVTLSIENCDGSPSTRRYLTVEKNRFGPVTKMGAFEVTESSMTPLADQGAATASCQQVERSGE